MRSVAFALGVLLIVGCSGGSDAVIDAADDAEDADAEWGPPDCCVFDDGPPGCAGLDPLTCRNTPGCTPAFCPGCACNPGYLGCFSPGSPPPQCPVLDCPSPACCHDDPECVGDRCIGPGESAGCGACNPSPSECDVDGDCQPAAAGGPQICEPIACSCNGGRTCVPGCLTAADCGAGETCDPARGRCHAQSCGPSELCPPDFNCQAGACARRVCASDANCDGFCVEGLCQGSLGQCLAPPP